jgi:glycosyltransferase involved in cell wall biosynthesis
VKLFQILNDVDFVVYFQGIISSKSGMTRTKSKALKILISAYACNPSSSFQMHPGEDLTGWKLVDQIARDHETWIITHGYNRKGIETAGNGRLKIKAHFIFASLPRYLAWLYKFGVGERLYYYFWQVAAWRVARRLHRQHHFDLCHHVTFGNYWMPSFIGAFLPIPFIWGPVGGGQKTPEALFRRYSLLGQFSEVGRDLAQWLGRNVLISRRLCLRHSSAILVCNKETKLLFPKKYWRHVLYFPVNGISRGDLPKSVRTRSGIKFRVLTAGRLIRLKGFDICIEAFARIAENYPNSVLEIVGQGPEEARLRKLAMAHNVKDKVFFVPWLERQSLLKKMRASDVFLFASFRDGGAAVVVEAMAAGLPVVCLDAGGPGFHVQEDWGIKIAPHRDRQVVEDMSRALTILYQRPAMRKKMGKAGYRRAKEYYLWDNLGKRLSKVYQSVLDGERLGLGTG